MSLTTIRAVTGYTGPSPDAVESLLATQRKLNADQQTLLRGGEGLAALGISNAWGPPDEQRMIEADYKYVQLRRHQREDGVMYGEPDMLVDSFLAYMELRARNSGLEIPEEWRGCEDLILSELWELVDSQTSTPAAFGEALEKSILAGTHDCPEEEGYTPEQTREHNEGWRRVLQRAYAVTLADWKLGWSKPYWEAWMKGEPEADVWARER